MVGWWAYSWLWKATCCQFIFVPVTTAGENVMPSGFWLSCHLWLYTCHFPVPGLASVSLHVGLHRALPLSNHYSWAQLKISGYTKRDNKKQNSPQRSVGNLLSKISWKFRLREREKYIHSLLKIVWRLEAREIHPVTTLELGHIQTADRGCGSILSV